MKSQLDLGVLFTGKLDATFDANIKKIKDALTSLNTSSLKTVSTNEQVTASVQKASKALGKYTDDVKKLLQMQARWYGAKAILFTAVDLPAKFLKEGFDQLLRVDTAVAKLRRYDAMVGDFSETSKQASKDIVELARALNLKYPIPFDDIIKSADRLRAAGVTIETTRGILEEFVRFQTAWPEVEMDKFTNAVVGMMNTFRKTPGLRELASDTERYKSILDKVTVALGVGVMQPKDTGLVMQHFGQMAQSIGLSVDEMLSLSVLVTNLGSKAGPAARALAGMATSLAQTDKIGLFQKLGIEIQKDIPLGQQFVSILEQLRKLVGTGETGYTAGAQELLGKIVSVERMKALLPVLRDLDTYKELLKIIQNSQDANKRAADAMSSSLENQIAIIRKWASELGSMIYEGSTVGQVLHWVISALQAFGVTLAGVLYLLKQLTTSVQTATVFLNAMLLALVDIANGNYKAAAQKFVDAWKWATDETRKNTKDLSESMFRITQGQMGSNPISGASPENEAKFTLAVEIAQLRTQIDKAKGDSSALEKLNAELKAKQKTLLLLVKNKEGNEQPTPTIPGTEKYSAKLAAEKAQLSASLAIEDLAAKKHSKILKDMLSLNMITEQDYYEDSIAYVNSSYARKIKEIKKEEQIINDLYQKAIEDPSYSKNKKDKEAVEAKKKADDKKIELQYAEAEAKKEMELSGLTTQKVIKGLEQIKTVRDSNYNLEISRINSLKEIEGLKLSEREKQTEYLYSHNYIKAGEYYDRLESEILDSTRIEREALQKSWQAYNDKLDKEWERAVGNNVETEKLHQDFLIKEQEKNQKEISLEETQNNKLAELRRKRVEDYEKIYGQSGALGVVKKYLEAEYLELQKYGNRWVNFCDTIAKGMSSSFEDFFFDVLQFNLKSAEDYFQSFLSSIQRSIAKFVTDEIVSYFLNAIKGLVSAYAGSTATGNNVSPEPNYAGFTYTGNTPTVGANVQHRGGAAGSGPTRSVPSWLFNLAPRLHTGLASDEYAAILQRGETVTPKGGSVVPNVEVNITNETGSEVSVNKSVSFDMDKMVIGIVLKDLAGYGSLYKALRGK